MTVVVGAAYWLNTPTYRVLFADMDPESAARVTERLRAQDVAFQLAEGGRSVLVPEQRLDELRLDFATTGLPSSGRMGFEIFDATQFGATEFLEQVNFRRALEGEIARSIATSSEVAAARVHISMAKDRLFGEQAQPAKASVVLKLRVEPPAAAPFVRASRRWSRRRWRACGRNRSSSSTPSAAPWRGRRRRRFPARHGAGRAAAAL